MIDDYMELGDGPILAGTTIDRAGADKWTATYVDKHMGEVTIDFSERPTGAKMIAYCDAVRRQLSERKKREDAKKASSEAARRAADKERASNEDNRGGSVAAEKETVSGFKETMEQRLLDTEEDITRAANEIAVLSLKRYTLEKEKAAIKAALEVFRDERDTTTRQVHREVGEDIPAQDADAGSRTSGNVGSDSHEQKGLGKAKNKNSRAKRKTNAPT
jgi:hypothetical protein